jgi:hypothetical protein
MRRNPSTIDIANISQKANPYLRKFFPPVFAAHIPRGANSKPIARLIPNAISVTAGMNRFTIEHLPTEHAAVSKPRLTEKSTVKLIPNRIRATMFILDPH